MEYATGVVGPFGSRGRTASNNMAAVHSMGDGLTATAMPADRKSQTQSGSTAGPNNATSKLARSPTAKASNNMNMNYSESYIARKGSATTGIDLGAPGGNGGDIPMTASKYAVGGQNSGGAGKMTSSGGTYGGLATNEMQTGGKKKSENNNGTGAPGSRAYRVPTDIRELEAHKAPRDWPRGCVLVGMVAILWLFAAGFVAVTAWLASSHRSRHHGVNPWTARLGGGPEMFGTSGFTRPDRDTAPEEDGEDGPPAGLLFNRGWRSWRRDPEQHHMMRTFGLLPLMPVLSLDKFRRISNVILPVNADQTVQRLYRIDMVERMLDMQDVELPAERRRRLQATEGRRNGQDSNNRREGDDDTEGGTGGRRSGRRGTAGRPKAGGTGEQPPQADGVRRKRDRGDRPDMTVARRERWRARQAAKNGTSVGTAGENQRSEEQERGMAPPPMIDLDVVQDVEGSGSLPLRALAITEGERFQMSGLSQGGERSGRKNKARRGGRTRRYLVSEREAEGNIVEVSASGTSGTSASGALQDASVKSGDLGKGVEEQGLIAEDTLYKPPIVLTTYLHLSLGHKLVLSTSPYGGALYDDKGEKLRAFDFGPYAKILRKIIESAEYEGKKSQLPSELVLMASHLGILKSLNGTMSHIPAGPRLAEGDELPQLANTGSGTPFSRVRRSNAA